MQARVDARNQLETYCYNMKNSVSDSDKLADKLEEEDKQAIDEAVSDALEWMDENSDADKEEYDEKLKEVEAGEFSTRCLQARRLPISVVHPHACSKLARQALSGHVTILNLSCG